MNNHCAFSKDHNCLKWVEYESTRLELEEADELCHGNWIEIQHLRDYIELLQDVMKQNSIGIPPEY